MIDFRLVLAMAFVPSIAAAELNRVDAFTFARAESDLYLSNLAKRNGGLNVLLHDREPTPIDEQTIVRMNRDTFYSTSLHDLAAGPVTVTMPENPDGRFQSLQVISQDHYTPFVIYDGTLELTQHTVGTRYVLLAFRTFVDPSDPQDIAAAHALQDGIRVAQADNGVLELPEWDPASRARARGALAELQSLGGTADKVRMGRPNEVDPMAHLMATATGWGLNPREAAIYFTGYPEPNDAQTVQQLVLGDVPQDGFWSISVYDANGYFAPNELGVYSVNNATAIAGDDGTTTIQFGGCDSAVVNCIPITDGWNYSFRVYRPKPEVLDGSWQPPEVTPVSASSAAEAR